jgi:ABC-type branched-subunit amino acid transport system substrate-binding protein
MGVVYLALAQGPAGFAKLKVIKRLRPDFAAEPWAVEMFLAEARLAARLRHPNVVQTNEVGFDGRHYFMEMEYLEGQSLDALQRRGDKTGSIPLPISLWILAQTCAGLHYAHELKDLDGTPLHVVHRDVSPHNVLVTYDGQVKVLDFGIAKAADSGGDTQTGMVKGKARYMAPEQAVRRTVDRRADVFAVGVMLWQALTGERLWGDLSDLEIFVKLQTADLPAPRTVKPDVPPALDALCARALSTKPEDRPATAAETGAAIEAYLEGSGARVGPRDVSALVISLFADRRAEVEREIEAQIRGRAATPETADVPTLAAAPETPATGSAALSHANSIRKEPPLLTKVRQLRQIRGLRRMTIVAIAVALLASASVAVVTLRARSRSASAARADASGAAAPGGCTTNRACGQGSICRRPQGRCVALESSNCKPLGDPGDAENDATIWFGVMLPTSGPRAELGTQFTHAVELARRDFAEISHGLPPYSGNGPPRPLAFVACDDAAGGEAPAHHLADDLGVPAVIGFGTSQEVVDLAQSVFVPHDVLTVAAVNQSALITSIPHPPGKPRLVFRTATGIEQIATPVSLFVSDWLEPRLREAAIVSDHTPMRVALVRPATTSALGIADELFSTLRFNGKSALENGESFRQFVFLEGGGEADSHGPAEVVREILTFLPHVVLTIGQGELAGPIYAPIESGWPTRSQSRPYFVSTGALFGDELFRLLGSDRERRRRYFAVQPPATKMANAKFTMRYNEVFSDRVSINTSPAGPYDAAYLLAYAAFAAGDQPITGPALAHAIGRLLPPGPGIDVGPTRILEALERLRSGRNVDLQGAAGRLDFDLATGESPADAVLQCVGVDAAGRAREGIDSGLHYDASSRAFQGQMRCP